MEEAALLASLRPLAAAIDLAVTIVDAAGRVLEWNPTAERTYGIPRTEILGRDIMGFFSPASLMVRRVLETGKAVEATYHQPRPGIHVIVTAAPVFEQGRLIGALAAERDITRMVELSAELTAAQDRVAALERRLLPSQADAADADPFSAVRGRHPALLQAIELARRIAPTEVTTLILGESGAGKELFARGIHRASRRARGPFIALNCGAIPAALFESELFGYASGAFTGANPKGQPGKLELAEGGTLFLDEVGDLPVEGQVKLLRFLEDRRFFRVGGSTPIPVDVRIVAATNQPLEGMVQAGRFRDDLYWRLNVISLELPPLRERVEDIPDLVQLFVHELSLRHGRSISRVEPAVVQALMAHSWPGNVRELRNLVERLVVLAAGGVVGRDLLPAILRPASPPTPSASPAFAQTEALGPEGLHGAVIRAERDEILSALGSVGNSRCAAAKLLGISRGTLYYKCKRLGIPLAKHPGG